MKRDQRGRPRAESRTAAPGGTARRADQLPHCRGSATGVMLRLRTSILVDGVRMGLGVETGADEGEQRQLLHFLLVGCKIGNAMRRASNGQGSSLSQRKAASRHKKTHPWPPDSTEAFRGCRSLPKGPSAALPGTSLTLLCAEECRESQNPLGWKSPLRRWSPAGRSPAVQL